MILIGGYEIDALLSVDPSHRSEVTIHPVEEGAKVSDHIIERPLTVNVTGIVSDSPIGLVALSRAEGSKPSADAYSHFQTMQKDKLPVSIESGVYPVFDHMVLLSISAPKSATTGASFRFSASFQQIEYAAVDTDFQETLVALPREKRKVNNGAQAAEDAPETPTAVGAVLPDGSVVPNIYRDNGPSSQAKALWRAR